MAGRRLLTVVVNVVVAPDGRLLYGTVIDIEEGVHGRFQDWAGLGRAAADWLAMRLARGDPKDD
jgi:hypothetical protein